MPSVNNASLSTRPKDSLKSTFLFKKCAFIPNICSTTATSDKRDGHLDLASCCLASYFENISYHIFPKNLGLASYFENIEFWCPGNRYFIVISRMGISNINLSFSQVYLCFPDFSWFYQNTVSINEDTQPKNTEKIVGAPEFWCPGTRTLVPFQVDNRFFVLISKMGVRNINLSFFSSVFMCP